MDENKTLISDEEEQEHLEQTRKITGYYEDVRYSGRFGEMRASLNKWDDSVQDVVVKGYLKKVKATDGSLYILPEGDDWMVGKTMDEFYLKANAYIHGYETRAERENALTERKTKDYNFVDHLSGVGEDLRFTGEVVIDNSLFVADPASESGFSVQPFARLLTTDGMSYAIKDELSPVNFMIGDSNEELVLKAQMYALGYMDRVRKEETIL